MMVKGRTLLGYDDKPVNRKKLKYSDWIIILVLSFPLWLSFLIAAVIATSIIFATLVIVFIIIGFSAIMLFVYSVFTLIDDLWPSVIKMGACLMASGITVIAIAALFKGIKVFFKLLKSGFQKIKNMLLLKKLEGQKDEQNT